MMMKYENPTVSIKHLTSNFVIQIKMDDIYNNHVVAPITTEDFMSFILDGYDDEDKSESDRLSDRYRAALLLKTRQGRFRSDLGATLINVRKDVVNHLKENAGENDYLEFYRVGSTHCIRIERKH